MTHVTVIQTHNLLTLHLVVNPVVYEYFLPENDEENVS